MDITSVLFSGFLESFEESRAQEEERLKQGQENIVSLLEHCSRVRSTDEMGGQTQRGALH